MAPNEQARHRSTAPRGHDDCRAGHAADNEFTSLFQRAPPAGHGLDHRRQHDSPGGKAALSGVHGPFSFGVGTLDWKSDGWRPNNDLRQAEYRHRETREGDLAFNFEPDDNIATRRVGRDIDSARLHLRWSPSVATGCCCRTSAAGARKT